MDKKKASHSLIVFDGICILCNWLVEFIIAKDRKDTFRFVMFQSEKSRMLFEEGLIGGKDNASIILIADGNVYCRSEAILRILTNFGGIWRMFYFFKFIPIPIRDGIYNLISKYRYQIFGKKKYCELPNTEIASKFL